MKKLTVMAACAALLLGGGCFLKANQMNNLLVNENILAFTEDGEGNFPPVKDAQNRPNYCTIYKYVSGSGTATSTDGKYVASLGVIYEKIEGLHDNCHNKCEGSICYPYPCRTSY